MRYTTLSGCLVLGTLLLAARPHGSQEPGRSGDGGGVNGEATSAVQDPQRDLNPVIRWNRIANEIFPVDVGPVIDSRAMTILHAAIHDAVNGIEGRYQPYTVALSSPGASPSIRTKSTSPGACRGVTPSLSISRSRSWPARWMAWSTSVSPLR